MRAIDINCDLGEGFGNYLLSNEREILHRISSCNIACGFHAGDPSVIRKTIQLAVESNVAIGAHPSYPDRQGFGRRKMEMGFQELVDLVMYQVCVLKALTEAHGAKLKHVKPHGSLYNVSASDENVCRAICKAIANVDDNLLLVGLPGSVHEKVAGAYNLSFYKEGFGDRRYNGEGLLVSRSERGSVLTDPTEAGGQIVRMATEGVVSSLSGSLIDANVDTICIHGDNPGVLEILDYAIEQLSNNGIEIGTSGT